MWECKWQGKWCFSFFVKKNGFVAFQRPATLKSSKLSHALLRNEHILIWCLRIYGSPDISVHSPYSEKPRLSLSTPILFSSSDACLPSCALILTKVSAACYTGIFRRVERSFTEDDVSYLSDSTAWCDAVCVRISVELGQCLVHRPSTWALQHSCWVWFADDTSQIVCYLLSQYHNVRWLSR